MRRPLKVGGAIVALGAGFAAVLWMLRDRLVAPGASPVSAGDAPAFRVAPPPAPDRSDAEDLSQIRGIGPVFKGRLAAAGIARFEEVAATPAARLAEIAGVSESKAAEWITQAKRLG
jgi:predicted flap endonuclease-1-like 5' DNA nuclease